MELLIFKKKCFSLKGENQTYLSKIYWDNLQMASLGQFLEDFYIDKLIDFIENPIEMETEELSIYLEGETIKISFTFFDMTIKQSKYYYENAFTFDTKKFFDFLEQWIYAKNSTPQFIIIKKYGDEKIEIEIKDISTTYFDLTNIKITNDFINNLFTPNIKYDLFCGLFHFENQSKDIIFSNNQIDQYDNTSYDIKFNSDYSPNHSFFSKSITKESLKQNLKNILVNYRTNELRNIAYFDSKKNYFITYISVENFPQSFCIIDDYLKVIALIPTFWRKT